MLSGQQSRFMLRLLFVIFTGHALGRFGPIQSMGQLTTTTSEDDFGGVERPLTKLPEYKTTTEAGSAETSAEVTLVGGLDVDKNANTTMDGAAPETVKAAAVDGDGSSDGRGRKDITWLYIMVFLAALLLLILLAICLCLLLGRKKGPYKPKIRSAETNVVEGGIAEAVFVNEHGKVSTTGGTPKTTPSTKSFQL